MKWHAVSADKHVGVRYKCETAAVNSILPASDGDQDTDKITHRLPPASYEVLALAPDPPV